MERFRKLSQELQKYKKYHNILIVSACFLLATLVLLFVKLFLIAPEKNSPIPNKTNTKTPTLTISEVSVITDLSPQPKSLNNPSPSQILNLTNWKITLPIGEKEKPTEIKQPNLAGFQTDPWFIALSNGSGVRFRAPINGVTTKGSDYPRSELREMTNNGTVNASWNSNSGNHTMYINEAVTHLPDKKRHIVVAQIHDSNEDVIVIRLDNDNLLVNVDGENVKTLDPNYTLGKRFSVKFVVKNGETQVFYNGSSVPSFILDKDYSGAYFKAGAYTQSNCSKEDSSRCNDKNYGEMVIYGLSVTHE